jgi:predicted nuclease of predicted toxin-antitoxin system
MRLLLDEHLDRRLKRFFSEEHEVVTVLERGWCGKGNGELIEAAQREFDALITMDQGIPHQQNLREVDLTIVLLEAPSNRLADLVPLVDEAKAVLSEARTGEVLRVQGL